MRYANSVMTTYYDGYDGAEVEPCVVVTAQWIARGVARLRVRAI